VSRWAGWERARGSWRDYPEGTMARDHIGCEWVKLASGWWRAVGGDVFPTPGASAMWVRLPEGAR